MANNNIQTKIRNYCNSLYTAIHLNKLGDMLFFIKIHQTLWQFNFNDFLFAIDS